MGGTLLRPHRRLAGDADELEFAVPKPMGTDATTGFLLFPINTFLLFPIKQLSDHHRGDTSAAKCGGRCQEDATSSVTSSACIVFIFVTSLSPSAIMLRLFIWIFIVSFFLFQDAGPLP